MLGLQLKLKKINFQILGRLKGSDRMCSGQNPAVNALSCLICLGMEIVVPASFLNHSSVPRYPVFAMVQHL